MRIPKYERQNLTSWHLRFWSVWIVLTLFCPLSWLPIRLWSVVMDPCFIHCHIPLKRSFLLCWNSFKQPSELSTRCCFWSTVSKRGTYFEQSFLMLKHSCKMVNTLTFDIFNVSSILRNFNLRSAKTILWTCFYVFWNSCQIWVPRAFSIIGVCTAPFKISKPLPYHLSRWSIVRITLFKTMLCLSGIFSH